MEEFKNEMKKETKELYEILFGENGFMYDARFGQFNEEQFDRAVRKIGDIRHTLDRYNMDEDGLGDVVNFVSELRESLLSNYLALEKAGLKERSKKFHDASWELIHALNNPVKTVKTSE